MNLDITKTPRENIEIWRKEIHFEELQWDLLEQLLENAGIKYFALSSQHKEILQELFFTKKEA
jgi:hypothetical protein